VTAADISWRLPAPPCHGSFAQAPLATVDFVMDNTLVLVGLNHKTAPVEVRERVSFSPEQVPSLLGELRRVPGLQECALLSTCNRTEFYAVAQQDAARTFSDLSNFLERHSQANGLPLERHLYRSEGSLAINHLFAVSSGLDSLVLGEGQILGQVRRAYLQAQEARFTGPVLERLFPWALRVGKKARSETGISRGASSVSAAAVDLAVNIFGDMAGRRVLLLGAGKMSTKALKLLSKTGVKEVQVVNRTFEKAAELAQQCGGVAVPFEALDKSLAEVDILISSTGAPHYLVTRERMSEIMRKRRGRPLFLVDIAMPRDFDPACGEVDNVYLYNIDDLQAVVDKNLARRHSETQAVLTLIESATKDFCRYLDSRQASTAIVTLRSSFDSLRLSELEHYRVKKNLDESQVALLEGFSRRLLAKLLHNPTEKLRQLSEGGATPEELMHSLELLGLVREAEE
jgi:glutamyl-tRNA reductase